MTDKAPKFQRLGEEVRRGQIIAALVDVAERTDYRLVTREQVAEAAGCTAPLVSTYLGTLPEIREFAVQYGIDVGNLKIIGQAMAARHPLARRLDFSTKLAAAAAYLDLPPLAAA